MFSSSIFVPKQNLGSNHQIHNSLCVVNQARETHHASAAVQLSGIGQGPRRTRCKNYTTDGHRGSSCSQWICQTHAVPSRYRETLPQGVRGGKTNGDSMTVRYGMKSWTSRTLLRIFSIMQMQRLIEVAVRRDGRQYTIGTDFCCPRELWTVLVVNSIGDYSRSSSSTVSASH